MNTRPSINPLPALARLAVTTLLIGAFCWPQLSEAKGKLVFKGIPDFTQPDSPKLDDNQAYGALGTTGAFGWIYNDTGYNSDGVTQVYIGNVEAKTPAAGELQKGDVILGASPGTTAKLFTNNARHEMGAALTQAELEQHGGQLALKVWRAGKTSDVQLTIPVVKGAYDVNSPLTSPKLQTEIDLLASAIAKRGLKGSDWKEGFDALGLLATGDKQYWPMLKTYANSLAVTEELNLNSRQKTAWFWGYNTLFLAEYYGATGDKSVLPDLEKYATALAKGQGYAGTWNHCVANPDLHGNDGQLHGRLGGYGAINQTTSACAIALAIAKKVGVDNKEISDAIQRSAEHFAFFVDKGSIPYGDHSPGMNHAANGKNASTAVFLDLIGDSEGATYFSRMTLASYELREGGHTGHFFSQFWGGLGAACSGDAALNAYTKELQWYLQLERRADGVILYQPLMMGGSFGKYPGWSMNGARLLQFCAPRKAIYLTGKGGRAAKPLTPEEIAITIESGRQSKLYEGRTMKELLGMLSSWSPVVRQKSAEKIGESDENVVDQLIAMLSSDNRYERYGACVGLRYAGRGSAKAVDALIEKGLKSNDIALQYYAAEAFAIPRKWNSEKKGWEYPYPHLGEAAQRGANELLKLAATDHPDQDPRNKLHFMLSKTLFYNGKVAGFTGLLADKKHLLAVDRKLLLAATASILTNQNGGARTEASGAVYPILTPEEIKTIEPDIIEATKVRAPSGLMFSQGVRQDGLKLLTAVKDPIAVELATHMLANIDDDRVKWNDGYVDTLESFGAQAKGSLPILRKMLAESSAELEQAQKDAQSKDEKKRKWGEVYTKRYTPQVKRLTEVIGKIESAS